MSIINKLFDFIIELNQYELSSFVHNIDEVKSSSDYFSSRLLKRANDRMKVDIPNKDYQYDSISSLTLDWDSSSNKPNEEYLWGGFELLGLIEALARPSSFWKIYNDSRFYKNNTQEEERVYKDFLPKLGYFHKSSHGDDGTFGCFYREEEVYPCKIYFYDSGIWFPIDLSLEEYYNKMMECNAVYYWQYFFIDTDIIVKKLGYFEPIYIEAGAKYIEGPAPFLDLYKEGILTTSAEGVLHQMKIIIKRFPTIFTGYDVSFFQEKYDALEEAILKL